MGKKRKHEIWLFKPILGRLILHQVDDLFSFSLTDFIEKATQKALAPVAQWIEHSFPKAGVAGSIPAGGASFTEVFADWAFSPFPYFTGLGLFLSPISDKTLTNFFRRNLGYQLAALFKNLGFLGG